MRLQTVLREGRNINRKKNPRRDRVRQGERENEGLAKKNRQKERWWIKKTKSMSKGLLAEIEQLPNQLCQWPRCETAGNPSSGAHKGEGVIGQYIR